jgi:glycosyltransferase involved in cell wall biosynthesis
MTRAIHVLSSISRLGGGIAPAVWTLAECQKSAGLLVALASSHDQYTSLDVAVHNDVTYSTGRAVGPKVFGYSPELRRYLHAQDGTIDILHSHGLWMYPGYAVHVVGRRDAIPYVVSPHGMLDSWALKNSAWKKKIAGWLYENRNLRSAACIHALCESEYQSIRAYGLKNPVCIIPNGVTLPEMSAEPPAPAWDGQVPAGKKVMLFLGRIHPKKGLPNLIEAWSRVKPKEWLLAIAGWDQGGHENQLKKLVKDLRLDKDIIFPGPAFDEKKKAYLQNADAFILPSFSEGLPMSVLEAWSYGLPVLMTEECNIPEGFEANAAIEIKPEPDSIAEALKEFNGLPEEEQKQIGRNGLKLVKDKFNWPKIATEMINVYKWVLGQADMPDCVRLD